MIVIKATVTDVYQVEEQHHVGGVGSAASFEQRKGNWYVTLNMLHSINVGAEKPKLEPGQKVRLTLEPEA